jgi:hypothetical protein
VILLRPNERLSAK